MPRRYRAIGLFSLSLFWRRVIAAGSHDMSSTRAIYTLIFDSRATFTFVAKILAVLTLPPSPTPVYSIGRRRASIVLYLS